MKALLLSTRLATAVMALALAGCAATNAQPWPAKVVSIDHMTLLTPLRMRFVHSSDEKSGQLTTVLVVHVDAEGKTVRSRVAQSSGLPRVDEAAKLALLDARFAPYVVDGMPQAVTVVMPFRVPVKKL